MQVNANSTHHNNSFKNLVCSSVFIIYNLKMSSHCFKCDKECVPKDDKSELFGFPCDICHKTICKNCSGIRTSEIRVLIMKERCLRHFCPECAECFSILPEMKKRLTDLEGELSHLKKSVTSNLDFQTNPTKGQPCNDLYDNKLDEVLSNITQQLEKQSEAISNKLIITVDAIKDANKELVTFLTMPSTKKNISNIQFSEDIPAGLTLPNTHTISCSTLKVCQTNQPTSGALTSSDISGKTGRLTDSSRSTEYNRSNPLKGTCSKPSIISAAQERQWVYVGNLSSDCTIEMIGSHLKSNHVEVLSCEKLTSKQEHVASFKVGIPTHVQNKIFNSEIWPIGVLVKPFVFPAANKGNYGIRNFRGRPRQQRQK